MQNEKPVIAIIPARGGSKGLPRKNILPLAGKPVLAWTIDAALQSNIVDMVYVTSEDEEVLSTAIQYEARTITRPDDLAQDTSSSEVVIAHAIDYIKNKEGLSSFYVMFLQPTSPLRTASDIDNAFKEFIDSHGQCLISVYEPSKTPFKSYKVANDGFLTGLIDDDAPYKRRQDLPVAYYPNGAIYIFESSVFCKEDKIPREEIAFYQMSEEQSLDIDEKKDLIQAEKILLQGR